MTVQGLTWSLGRRAGTGQGPAPSGGLAHFKQRIEADALYLLDELENSLCAAKQIELAKYLEESARYMGCQLIISTHSPFFTRQPTN